MDDNSFLAAGAIGHFAHDILRSEKQVNICGNTSKGLFAVTDKKRILFITHLTFKGPFTINIDEKIPAHYPISLKANLLLSPDRIKFNDSGFEIRINPQTRLWTPEPLDKLDFNLPAFYDRTEQIKQEMMSQLSSQDQSQDKYLDIENSLKSALSVMDETAVYQSLVKFLGKGEGLTPFGDDFICGFLLAAHTWKEILYPGFTMQKTIQNITKAAWGTTTALSANLISCALAGSADERIIHCLSWLNSGHNSSAVIMKELLSYGSSSGLDTLAGMLTFIKSSPVFDQGF